MMSEGAGTNARAEENGAALAGRHAGDSVRRATRGALFGTVLVALGMTTFVLGALLGVVRLLVGDPDWLRRVNEIIVWYSATPVVAGLIGIAFDIFVTVRSKRGHKRLRDDVIPCSDMTVVLTAYNDELSIYQAVMDFRACPYAKRVIVISNNSVDSTMAEAERAGAIVYNERLQGYGACVHRALTEGCRYADTDLVLLCEGDMTFRASDSAKFIAYAPHADIVNGTRIVEQLQDAATQLSTFMHYGNLAVGKLLEMKYLGEATLTDVGTTYKLCRSAALRTLLPALNPRINLEFCPHFLEQAIRLGLGVIECPITFHPRVGVSKGGNVSDRVALKVGLRMIVGILFGWKFLR
jgi:hypothetical protein